MDWLDAFLDSRWAPVATFVLGGVFQAVLAYFLAVAADNRAEKRQQLQWLREDQVAVRDRVRTAMLRNITQTREYLVASEHYLTARAEGTALAHPGPSFPYADEMLVADLDLEMRRTRMSIAILRRPPGSGMSREQLEEFGAVHSLSMRRLEIQEAHALADEPLEELEPGDQETIARTNAELEQMKDSLAPRTQ